MKKTRSVLTVLLLFILLLCGCAAVSLPETTAAETASPEPADDETEPILLAWSYRPTSLTELPEGVDVLAPTWFYAEADEAGQAAFRDLEELGYSAWDPVSYVRAAHAANVSVWGTFVSFDNAVNQSLAQDETVRSRLVERLVGWVEACELDGICMDVENMDPEARFGLTETLRALREALPGNVLLCAAVTAPPAEGEPLNVWQCYDYAGLAEVCDYVALMAYDNGGSEPVSTSPLSRVREQVTALRETTPAEKLLLGVPMYGLDYEQVTGDGEEESWIRRTITPSRARTLREDGVLNTDDETIEVGVWLRYGEWDAQAGETLYEYTDLDEHRHMLWCEDAASLETKGALVSEYHLAGAAVWRLEYGQNEREKELWEGLVSGMTEGAQ